MRTVSKEMETMSVIIHTTLMSLHAVGCVYHLLHKRWKHAAVHAGVAIYDGYSVFIHASRRNDAKVVGQAGTNAVTNRSGSGAVGGLAPDALRKRGAL